MNCAWILGELVWIQVKQLNSVSWLFAQRLRLQNNPGTFSSSSTGEETIQRDLHLPYTLDGEPCSQQPCKWHFPCAQSIHLTHIRFKFIPIHLEFMYNSSTIHLGFICGFVCFTWCFGTFVTISMFSWDSQDWKFICRRFVALCHKWTRQTQTISE